MERLSDLPEMPRPALPHAVASGVREMHEDRPLCGGCGAKVGSSVLRASLSRLPRLRDDVETGAGDDAAVLLVGGRRQVLTTDHLRAFTEDPVTMTRIAALHALGDIWAMGAVPQAVLTSITLPRLSPRLQARTMTEIMATAAEVFAAEGASIVGGHSTMGAELMMGFTVTGLLDRPAITQGGARPGDVLILTRPIGSGVILAAEMARLATGTEVARLFGQMRQSQAAAARTLSGAHAMTDVTGFGLGGHLMAMARASGCGIEIDLAAVPLHDGALRLAEAGVRSSLYEANRADLVLDGPEDARTDLLCDPQTAGGLLAAVAPDEAEGLLARLRDDGCPATRIGRVTAGPARLRLS